MMRNGDLPAMPNLSTSGIATSVSELREMLSENRVTIGLTKREQFAGMAMQGLLAKDDDRQANNVARQAVENADALLIELEESSTPASKIQDAEAMANALEALLKSYRTSGLVFLDIKVAEKALNAYKGIA